MTHSRGSIFGLMAMLLVVSAATQWWAGRSQAQLGDALAALAQPGDIRMLSSTTCGYCKLARQWMQRHGVAFG
jgi:phage gp46-like protein